MAYNGADVNKLRAAATQFNQLAGALESSAKTVNSLIGNPWWGSDADRFRAQWTNVLRPGIAAAVALLRQGADDLRRNAAEQEQVSSTKGGAGPVAASTYQTQPAPTGTQGLFSTILSTNGSYDGVMIQQVVGDDGKTRFIAYFNGTDAAERLTAERNLGVVWGGADHYLLDRIDQALKDAGYQPGADGTYKNGPDVMLVGYSQGGMDAQNIASDGRYHVTDLVTYGSPLTHPDNPNINTIHLRADGDNVPDLPAEAVALATGDPAGAAVIRAGLIDGPGDQVPFDDPLAGASQNIHQYDPGVAAPAFIDNGQINWNSGLVGNHGLPQTYQHVGADFDSSTDPTLAEEHRSLQRFQGDVVQTWNAATRPPSGGGGGGDGW